MIEMTKELAAISSQLLSAAKSAADYSYAPYSRFRVGAAVLANKQVFVGANIENASSNLGICAERVAISHALVHGCYEIEGIAICCIDTFSDKPNEYSIQESMPCGGCRQWISELAPNAWIITHATNQLFSINDLLPTAFKIHLNSKVEKI
jgi:cytidine deaminase